VMCGNAFSTTKFAVNIVVGSDHPLEEQWRLPGIVDDFTNCNNFANPVDQVRTWTGNAANALEDGLFNGISTPSLEGRLLCKGSLSSSTSGEPSWADFESSSCQAVLNTFPEELDDTPLWEFIIPGANAEVEGGACVPGGNPVTSRAQMVACLDGWNDWATNNGPHTLSLFSLDILSSPRFAAIPVLDNNPSTGVGAYTIESFVPAYLETIYLNCAGFSCNLVYSPGVASSGSCPTPLTDTDTSCGWPGFGNKVLEAVTAYVLNVDMLDPALQKSFPGRPGTVVYNLLD